MARILQGSPRGFPDVQRFLQTLGDPPPEARGLFDPQQAVVVTRAPGRLDVMGGIADYSGSLVLQLPLREATLVALQPDPCRRLRIVSLKAAENDRASLCEMPLSELERNGKPVAYEVARAFFQSNPPTHWASYVAGAFLVLMRELGASFPRGARILVSSDVPEGKGVSSSAALEVAAMQAITRAFRIPMEPRRGALLCQQVENLVVGAPCGVMDQMTASSGRADHLLCLLCQPAEVQEMVPLPEEIALWGVDSGVRHFVSGADYTSVRVGAFMGYRMIAELAGLTVEAGREGGPVRVLDPVWRGYLANVTPSVFGERFASQLPEHIRGAEFLARFGGTSDPMSRVRPEAAYAVRVPTAHPIYEHVRVRTFAELLQSPAVEGQLELMGELMHQSHASYAACGLGSEGTDRLVHLVRAAEPRGALYGAKITGGGSGGTVAVLGRRDAGAVLESVVDQYAWETGYRPSVFAGSSPGAAEFGHLMLERLGSSA